jgi:transcription antitermination factor NusG
MQRGLEQHEGNQLGCYAVKVQSRSEDNVSEALRFKGFDAFSPTYIQQRRYSDRIKRVRCALFPGYVFVRMGAEELLPIVATAGVSYIVRSGKSLHPLPPEEADAIGRLCKIESACEPCPTSAVGQRVRIESGPLQGIQGILTSVGKNHHVVVPINSIFRSIRIDTRHTFVKVIEPLSEQSSAEVIQQACARNGSHGSVWPSFTGNSDRVV